MKNIFFVISFGSIYRRVLPLIDSKKDEDNLVVTPNENIYKFFTKYTTFPTIQIKIHPNLITRKTWYKALSNAIKSKYEYHKTFSGCSGCNVYFFGTGSTIVVFSYIQKLAKQNQIFFYTSEPNKLEKQIKPTIVENWKTNVICFGVKVLLGIDIKVRRDCGIYSLCIYKDFFEQNNIKETYQEFDPSIYKSYIKDLPILKDKKVLLLISDLVGEGRVELGDFCFITNQLCWRLLDKRYPNQYVVKAHPNMNTLYGLLKEAPQVDYFIPSQFLMSHPWEIVIADCSASLVFPEEQNLNGVKLIELVDVLHFKDKKVQQELKDFLVKWNPNLLFPQSFEELEVMLNEKRLS